MAFKDILNKMGEKGRAKKALFQKAQEQLDIQTMIEERQKSANERELERFHKEDREEQIKIDLDEHRKIRQRDINLNHNPLDVPNITRTGDFEVLKQRNIFSGRSTMFENSGSMLNSNSNPLLSHNNMRLLN